MFCLALLALGMGHALETYHHNSQRLKEDELLYIGGLYRQAIQDYYLASPGTVKRYPMALEELLIDKRLLTTRRYIRKLYPDPVTGKADWGLVRESGGGIIGVYSPSEAAPIKQANFLSVDADFEGKRHYLEWRFVYFPNGRIP